MSQRPKQRSQKTKKGPRLTLSMIVRNEEQFLEGCLHSVQGVVDEIVIADTGSSDRTIDIARGYGARVISIPWQNDFSAARNASLQQATGDWILYLDADERLASGQGVTLRALLSNTHAGAFTLLVGGDIELQAGRFAHSNAYPRLFRRYPLIRFEGKVHEQIAPSIQRLGMTIVPSNIVVEHLGYAQGVDITREKCKRNIALLRTQLEEDPDDAYARFQLGNSLTILKQFGDARGELEQALRSPLLSSPIRANIMNLFAEIDVNEQQFERALECYRESLRYAPRQTMARWFMGGVLMNQRRFDEAIPLLQELAVQATGCGQTPPIDIAYDLMISVEELYYRLGHCYASTGRYLDAEEALFRSLQHSPDLNDALPELLRVQELLNKPITGIAHLEQLRRNGLQTADLLLALARLYWNAADQTSALRVVEEAMSSFPEDVRGYELDVRWKLEEGRSADAEETLSRAESRGVISFELDRQSLQAALKRNDVHGACRYLERMLDNIPPNLSAMKPQLMTLASRLSSELYATREQQ